VTRLGGAGAVVGGADVVVVVVVVGAGEVVVVVETVVVVSSVVVVSVVVESVVVGGESAKAAATPTPNNTVAPTTASTCFSGMRGPIIANRARRIPRCAIRHDQPVDAFLAIASKRDLRAYRPTPIAEDVQRRILDAGRLAGSSANRQNREFVVVERAQEELARTVWAPQNVATAQLVVAIVGAAGAFDVGRAAQNMMLAAWNDGVASCPNGIRDPEPRVRSDARSTSSCAGSRNGGSARLRGRRGGV
jgi:Nitroreductase family